MITYENTYWNSRGKYQILIDALRKKIPLSGSVDDVKNNPALEKYRMAINCYYDLYNNGLCNRGRQFPKVFGFGASKYKYNQEYSQIMYNKTEEEFDKIILAAAAEQLNKV